MICENRPELRGDAAVSVMQTADDGDRNKLCRTRGRDCLFARNRSFSSQPLMGPGGMVIIIDELCEQQFEMPLVQYDDVIEKFPSESSNESLDIGILPGAAIGRPDLLDAAPFQEGAHTVSVDTVVVPEEILRLLSEGRCLP
jgi:hypothetical protein